MEMEVLKQARSIRLERSDWSALAEIAKAQNRSVNNYLETLVKRAISVSRQTSPDNTQMSKEAFFAKLDKALQNIESGNFVEVRTREELHDLLDSL